MRAASRVLLLALLLPLLACEKSPGGVHVVVSGPLTPGVDFDRLSVVASLPEGTPLAMASLEGDALKLPATFNFESGPATPEGTRVSVRATAERSGMVRSTTSGEATLTPGSGTTLELSLPPIPVPPDAGTPVEACDNGVDDDGDDLRDCADPDCDGQSCQPGGLTCGGGVCGCAGGPTGTVSEQPGFTRRTAPLALSPAVGPYADTLVVTGGRDGAGRPVATVEVWSPESGGLARGSLLVARGEASALALTDGGVVVLGGTAGKALFGSAFRVGETRGRLVDWPSAFPVDEPPAWVLPTTHPSAVLRSTQREEDLAALVADLKVAAESL